MTDRSMGILQEADEERKRRMENGETLPFVAWWLDREERTLPSQSSEWYKAFRALRAVTTLHKPYIRDSGECACEYCSGIAPASYHCPWPCPTILAIDEALR